MRVEQIPRCLAVPHFSLRAAMSLKQRVWKVLNNDAGKVNVSESVLHLARR